MFEWEDYAMEYALTPASRKAQLMQCLSSELKQKVHARVVNYRTKPIDNLIAEIKSLTVHPVAIGKRRRTARTASQGEGELFGSSAARVKALALALVDCEYTLDCPHAKHLPDSWKSDRPSKCNADGCVGVDFEEAVIRDILLAGIKTEETRRVVLATK